MSLQQPEAEYSHGDSAAAPAVADAPASDAHAVRKLPPFDLDKAITVRGGLPRLRERAAAASCGAALGASVAFVGGSVTAQREGWRPAFHAWLNERIRVPMGHQAHNASLGNAGSKLLSFLVDDVVCAAGTPNLVFIDTVVNDGDNLLESGDEVGILRALEGIVRALRSEGCELVLVEMHLRTDLPKSRRSGTLAWVDSENVTDVYESARLLHERVADHYGLTSVSVTRALRALDAEALDAIYRDDCHTTPFGATVIASIVAAAVDRCLTLNDADVQPANLPAPLDDAFWAGGAAYKVERSHILSERLPEQRMDTDALTSTPGAWWLLSPGDALQLEFTGTALALVTHIGPDSGVVLCEITPVDSTAAPPRVSRHRHVLFDRWAYYYRLAVVLLADGMPMGRYRARITLETDAPDRSVANKAPQPRVSGELRLWTQYYLTCV